jgi:hypothetical protein
VLPLIENYDQHPDQGRPDIQAIYGFSAIKKSEIESTGNWATDTISSLSNFWLVILPDGSTGFETDSGRANWCLQEKQRFPVRGYTTPEDPVVPGSNVYFMNVFIDTWTKYPDVFGPWSSLHCCSKNRNFAAVCRVGHRLTTCQFSTSGRKARKRRVERSQNGYNDGSPGHTAQERRLRQDSRTKYRSAHSIVLSLRLNTIHAIVSWKQQASQHTPVAIHQNHATRDFKD